MKYYGENWGLELQCAIDVHSRLSGLVMKISA